MNVVIEDFKTGWFGLSIGLKPKEIDFMIESLQHIKAHPEHHFHAHSEFKGDGGVADMQICLVADDFKENMWFDEAK